MPRNYLLVFGISSRPGSLDFQLGRDTMTIYCTCTAQECTVHIAERAERCRLDQEPVPFFRLPARGRYE